jgi:hypothetical protein
MGSACDGRQCCVSTHRGTNASTVRGPLTLTMNSVTTTEGQIPRTVRGDRRPRVKFYRPQAWPGFNLHRCCCEDVAVHQLVCWDYFLLVQIPDVPCMCAASTGKRDAHPTGHANGSRASSGAKPENTMVSSSAKFRSKSQTPYK